MNGMIEINAGSLTYSALIELLHGNHVAQKHILADFYNGGIDASAALSRLEGVRRTGDTMIEVPVGMELIDVRDMVVWDNDFDSATSDLTEFEVFLVEDEEGNEWAL
jgi:hypothetical protein